MSDVICPSCDAPSAKSPSNGATCVTCGAPLLVAARIALRGAPLGDLGIDVADRAAPLIEGEDVTTRKRVLVRRAKAGDDLRLKREARILRGLRVRGVPPVDGDVIDDGHVRALVLPHPGADTLERALDGGLRTDDAGGTRFLRALLGILADLHALSPPVFHRGVNPHAVLYDPTSSDQAGLSRNGVTLVDFARATDVVDDATTDPVLARAGYAPSESVGPVALDLYGAAATTVHLLTRTPLQDLPHDDAGQPLYRARANVGAHLASVLDRMLGAKGAAPFRSVEEAIDALEKRRGSTSSSGPSPTLFAAFAMLALVVAGGASAFLFLTPVATPSPGPETVVDDEVSETPAPEEAPSPPPTPAPDPTPPPVEDVRPRAPRERPTPHAAEAPPPIPSDRARIEALRKVVVEQERVLTACATGDDDRWRFTVEASAEGELRGVTPRDKARMPSTQCAARALSSLRFSNPGARPFSSEVTVYVKPSFRVTVF